MRILIGLWLACHSLLALAQTDPFPQVAAAYWVEVNGQPLWQKQSQRRLPMASLTKLMTVLLVLENLPDDAQRQAPVTIGRAAAMESGSRIGLRAGEVLSVRDLLTATLVASANDACHALADFIAGSEAQFVLRMNRRARELGLRHTQFVNACGHDAAGHYASAQDLALLAQAVLEYPLATELSALSKTRIATRDGTRSYPLKSTNALIGRYPGALGLKTGHTARAGNCLVAFARRGPTRVLLVLLHGTDRWWDAVDLLDLAFAHAADPT